MAFVLGELALGLALLLAMGALLAAGRRLGQRRRMQHAEGAHAGNTTIEAAIFALVGLLLAFTISGAAQRFDARRGLVAEEANRIGTAWLRLDLLAAPAQPALRERFRAYLDLRIAMHRTAGELERAAEFARTAQLQGEIWALASAALRASADPPATMLVLPALDEMIDVTTSQRVATWMHPPPIIFALLLGLALTAALLAGYSSAQAPAPSWIHLLSFAVAITAAIGVIIDLEYPRAGLLRVNAVDQLLVDLRSSMD